MVHHSNELLLLTFALNRAANFGELHYGEARRIYLPRTRMDRGIMSVPLRAAKGDGLCVCPCKPVVRTPGAPK